MDQIRDVRPADPAAPIGQILLDRLAAPSPGRRIRLDVAPGADATAFFAAARAAVAVGAMTQDEARDVMRFVDGHKLVAASQGAAVGQRRASIRVVARSAGAPAPKPPADLHPACIWRFADPAPRRDPPRR